LSGHFKDPFYVFNTDIRNFNREIYPIFSALPTITRKILYPGKSEALGRIQGYRKNAGGYKVCLFN